ncbi:unnamed protein product [Owenia fusiformis]|uniref:P-type domain-containing protein n=1 Tax=Owenia fusiformis TaxID=6347 RepID=A0A8S4NLL8_OWEFU|nr:unnamed protein product [Owenia fusiformis]
MWPLLVFLIGLNAAVISKHQDVQCQGSTTKLPCPYGSNISSSECEYYNCCYDNSSSPICYQRAPECVNLACGDNETTTIECPVDDMIRIARVGNAARTNCNGTDICLAYIRYPNNTKAKCNNKTKCALPNKTYENGQSERCTTYDERGKVVYIPTTSQFVCFRCYPIPTTTTSTTTTVLPTTISQTSSNSTVDVHGGSGLNIPLLLYIVVPAIVVVVVAFIMLGLWYKYRYKRNDKRYPPSSQELREIQLRPDILAANDDEHMQYEDVFVAERDNDRRTIDKVNLENDAKMQKMIELETLYAKPEKKPPPVPKKNFKRITPNTSASSTSDTDPISHYSLEKRVGENSTPYASSHVSISSSPPSLQQDSAPDEATKGYPEPVNAVAGEYDSLNLGTDKPPVRYDGRKRLYGYSKVKDTSM